MRCPWREELRSNGRQSGSWRYSIKNDPVRMEERSSILHPPELNIVISFIIPAHNEEALIGWTLEAIHQSAKEIGLDYEIIVVDDASTDGTSAIALQHHARVIKVAHRQI